MRKYIITALAAVLIFGTVGCSRENGEQESISKAETLSETEAVTIMSELVEKANRANYISAGVCETNVNTVTVSGYYGTGILEPVVGAESTEELEEYFYSIFEEETARKYLYPITSGITIDGVTRPLYYNGDNGLTRENRALADPLLLGEWKTDNIEIISAEQNVITASVPYSFAYAPNEEQIGELRAVYDGTSESWKLDDSYGLSFIGQTVYESEKMTENERQSAVLDEIFDNAEIAEAFLTKHFYNGTDKQYTDFFTTEESGEKKYLNTDVLLEEKPEFREILSDDDPVSAIQNHINSCFTPAFAGKFSMDEMYSYDKTSGKLYVSETDLIDFLGQVTDRYKIASFDEDRIVLLIKTYEAGFFEDDDIHYRYVYIVKRDGKWKLTESVMLSTIIHVPDMYFRVFENRK